MSLKKTQFALLVTLTLAVSYFNISSVYAQQKPFDKIVVFGGSLDDAGNANIILSNPAKFGFDHTCNIGTAINVPPYDKLDDLNIPDGVYAKGGHHVSNGSTWVENLGRNWALAGSTRPALRNEGKNASNFAVGGARALEFDCRFNLSDQFDEYLSRFEQASPDTLFIFNIGGNDLRDMMVGLVSPTEIATIVGNISNAIISLYGRGGRHFLIANMPNFGQTPAVQKLDSLLPQFHFPLIANNLTLGYNNGLLDLQAGLSVIPDIDVRILDFYSLFNRFMTTPDDFGLMVIDATCVTPNVAPYTCSNPDEYLFWDGIHPTKAIHELMAHEAADVMTTP